MKVKCIVSCGQFGTATDWGVNASGENVRGLETPIFAASAGEEFIVGGLHFGLAEVSLLVKPSSTFPLPLPRLVWLPITSFAVLDGSIDQFQLFIQGGSERHLLSRIFTGIDHVSNYAHTTGPNDQKIEEFFNEGEDQ